MTSEDPQRGAARDLSRDAPLGRPGAAAVPATLGWIVPYALGLAAASLFGRSFVPAAVGTVRWSDQLLVADGFVAQALGALSTALLAVLLVRASISTRSVPLRIVVTVVGGFTMLLAMTSSGGLRTPDPILFATSIASGLVCIIVAASGARRLPELALGLAALSGFARLAAVQLTAKPSGATEIVATVGFVLELGVVAVVSAFLLRARTRGAIVIGVALVCTILAAWLLVLQPESSRWVLLRHAIEELAPRPHPLGPALLAPCLALFALVLSVGVCIARRADSGAVGAVALIVAVRAHAEVPLLGIALTVAAVALFLARGSAVAFASARPAAARGNSPRPEPENQGDRLAPGPPLD